MISFSARIRVNPPNFMIDFGYELELNHCPFIASTPIPEYTVNYSKLSPYLDGHAHCLSKKKTLIVEHRQSFVLNWRRKNKKMVSLSGKKRWIGVSVPFLLYTSRKAIFLRLRYFSLSIGDHHHGEIWQKTLNNLDSSKTIHPFCPALLRRFFSLRRKLIISARTALFSKIFCKKK